jgi:biopolymer transport protein ExbD
MNWLGTNDLGGLRNRMWSVALPVVVAMIAVVPAGRTQALQQGISVELARTRSAVPVPDADNRDALIVTVTNTGGLYFGINSVAPDELAQQLKDSQSQRGQNLYIKADARAPYASVVKVLDAAHTAGFLAVTLLTTQPTATKTGAIVPPEGIPMELAQHAPSAGK